MKTLHRHAAAAVAAVATVSVTLVVVPSASADHQPRRQTDYGFAGRAFGSLARAEALGVGSGATSPARLGCTRLAGVHRRNFGAATGGEAGSALEVTGVENTMRTYRGRRQTGTIATSKVAEAVLGDAEGTNLTFTNLRTTSKAFARRRDSRLGAAGSARAGGLDANTGTPIDAVLNSAGDGFDTLIEMIKAAPGQKLLIPSFGELGLGPSTTRSRRHRATAHTAALRARLFGQNGQSGGNDDVRVALAVSRAVIHDEMRSGVFRGRAVPLRSVLAGGLLSVGRIADRVLPCPGTGGEVRDSTTVDVDLGNAGLIDVEGLTARVFGAQRRNRSARAWTSSTINGVSLGGGEVEIRGLVGRVNVTTNRNGRVVRNNLRGSRVGELRIGGQVEEAPSPGEVIEVPGVGDLEFFVRDRRKRGSHLTALRITHLPGTQGESVIDLGQASTFIQRN